MPVEFNPAWRLDLFVFLRVRPRTALVLSFLSEAMFFALWITLLVKWDYDTMHDSERAAGFIATICQGLCFVFNIILASPCNRFTDVKAQAKDYARYRIFVNMWSGFLMIPIPFLVFVNAHRQSVTTLWLLSIFWPIFRWRSIRMPFLLIGGYILLLLVGVAGLIHSIIRVIVYMFCCLTCFLALPQSMAEDMRAERNDEGHRVDGAPDAGLCTYFNNQIIFLCNWFDLLERTKFLDRVNAFDIGPGDDGRFIYLGKGLHIAYYNDGWKEQPRANAAENGNAPIALDDGPNKNKQRGGDRARSRDGGGGNGNESDDDEHKQNGGVYRPPVLHAGPVDPRPSGTARGNNNNSNNNSNSNSTYDAGSSADLEAPPVSNPDREAVQNLYGNPYVNPYAAPGSAPANVAAGDLPIVPPGGAWNAYSAYQT